MASKTVLLAWELGGGMGHVTALHRLAGLIKHLDVRLVAVVKNPVAAATLSAAGVEVVQAPPWPSAARTPAEITRTSSSTMGDILATAGLADPAGLNCLLRGWEDHFIRIKPDLVVADLAPAAALIAHGRVPLVLTGNGFTLPPSDLPRFPALHRLAPPAFEEEETLSIVNAALKAHHRPSLDFLPQVFAADARLVLTFPLLDPYRSQRAQAADGPVFEQAPIPAAADARTVFCYFSRGYPLHPDLPRALLAHADGLEIHAPELPEAEAGALQRAGASIAIEPAPAARALAAASLVVHFGGSGLAAEALAAGVPQLILSMQVEQDLNGSALQDAALGRVVHAWDPASRLPTALLDDLLQDTGLARRAAEAGRRHRAWLAAADPAAAFERTCRELLCV
jgi:hypothetical protein